MASMSREANSTDELAGWQHKMTIRRLEVFMDMSSTALYRVKEHTIDPVCNNICFQIDSIGFGCNTHVALGCGLRIGYLQTVESTSVRLLGSITMPASSNDMCELKSETLMNVMEPWDEVKSLEPSKTSLACRWTLIL